jgi:hypothetical protein
MARNTRTLYDLTCSVLFCLTRKAATFLNLFWEKKMSFVGASTLSIMALGITTFSITMNNATLSITTLSITTPSIMALGITTPI